MSLRTVARDDLRNTSRSYVVGGVIGVCLVLITLIFVSEIHIYDDPYRSLWDVWAFIAFVGPLVFAPLSYLSIAGDRQRGTIKYVLGLPNSRFEYFAGKVLARTGVAVVAIVGSLLSGFCVAALTFTNPPNVWRFVVFTGVSIIYVTAVVSVFVTISASTGKRSRAMFGTLAVYFLFVPFWFGFFPVISLETILDAIASGLGVTISEQTRRRIVTLSPAVAYLEATQPTYSGVMDEYDVFAQFASSTKLVGTTWFNVLVMVGWSAVSLATGYFTFRSSELG